MKITIDPFDSESIINGIVQLNQYKEDVKRKEKLLLERLAFLGATQVSLRFSRSVYKYQPNIEVTSEIIGTTCVIKASGEEVCFIEFGAGVRFGNGYLGQRPDGVVGIGEYGNGKGNNPKGWWFTKDGKSEHTYGNPPAMAMYHTMKELTESINDIAREVFRT